MKLTPLDIRHKEFKRGMRGYVDGEVDEFLDEIADEFERLFKENIELSERGEALQEKIDQYRNLEETLQNTLVAAQRSAEELKANAQKEAQLMLQRGRAQGAPDGQRVVRRQAGGRKADRRAAAAPKRTSASSSVRCSRATSSSSPRSNAEAKKTGRFATPTDERSRRPWPATPPSRPARGPPRRRSRRGRRAPSAAAGRARAPAPAAPPFAAPGRSAPRSRPSGTGRRTRRAGRQAGCRPADSRRADSRPPPTAGRAASARPAAAGRRQAGRRPAGAVPRRARRSARRRRERGRRQRLQVVTPARCAARPTGVRLAVWVTPGGRRSEIGGVVDGRLRVRVAAPAVEGRANRELCRFLAATLGVPPRRVAVTAARAAVARRSACERRRRSRPLGGPGVAGPCEVVKTPSCTAMETTRVRTGSRRTAWQRS